LVERVQATVATVFLFFFSTPLLFLLFNNRWPHLV
jgi:hypothetical protein